MSNAIGAILATLITIPYLVFLIVNFSTYQLTKKRKKAFKASSDITTFFLFFAIERMTEEIWGQSYYWILLLLFLGGCFLFTFFIWKNDLELSISKIVRLNWRLQFIILTLCYFSLMTYGIIKSIMEV